MLLAHAHRQEQRSAHGLLAVGGLVESIGSGNAMADWIECSCTSVKIPALWLSLPGSVDSVLVAALLDSGGKGP